MLSPVTFIVPKPIVGAPLELICLGDHIKKKRLGQRILQRELAELFGVSVETILHWERSRTAQIPFKHYPAIMEFLGYCPVEHYQTEGEKLRLYRKHAGLKQTELGKKIGSDGSCLARWENDRMSIPEKKKEILKKSGKAHRNRHKSRITQYRTSQWRVVCKKLLNLNVQADCLTSKITHNYKHVARRYV